MDIVFTQAAWKDYLYWQQNDKSILKKINQLIEDIRRDPISGLGKPEPLKYRLAGFYSRRITQEHRLVYKIERDNVLQIISVRYHYG